MRIGARRCARCRLAALAIGALSWLEGAGGAALARAQSSVTQTQTQAPAKGKGTAKSKPAAKRKPAPKAKPAAKRKPAGVCAAQRRQTSGRWLRWNDELISAQPSTRA